MLLVLLSLRKLQGFQEFCARNRSGSGWREGRGDGGRTKYIFLIINHNITFLFSFLTYLFSR